MTQVIEHDYGKSKVTLRQIRAAIKAVNAEKLKSGRGVPKRDADDSSKANLPGPTKRSRRG
jgi:hypothetical protein